MASKPQTKLKARLRENIAMAEMAIRELKAKQDEGNVAIMSIKAMALTSLSIKIREDCACLLHGKEMLREDTAKSRHAV